MNLGDMPAARPVQRAGPGLDSLPRKCSWNERSPFPARCGGGSQPPPAPWRLGPAMPTGLVYLLDGVNDPVSGASCTRGPREGHPSQRLLPFPSAQLQVQSLCPRGGAASAAAGPPASHSLRSRPAGCEVVIETDPRRTRPEVGPWSPQGGPHRAAQGWLRTSRRSSQPWVWAWILLAGARAWRSGARRKQAP